MGILISYRLWQRRWNGDPSAVGKRVIINGHSFTIVGVAAEGFRGCVLPIGHDLWVPIHAQPLLQPSLVDRLSDRRFAWLDGLVGRLKPGATLAQAQAAIALIGGQLQRDHGVLAAGTASGKSRSHGGAEIRMTVKPLKASKR